MDTPLLNFTESTDVEQVSSEALIIDDGDDGDDDDDCTTDENGEHGYSLSNEVCFFFHTGIPLGLSAFFKWGAPPLFAMVIAGRTQESVHLQSALGIGRVFVNCTMLMVACGLLRYIFNVIPGCIGANRKDRIPTYFKRSMILTSLFMIPGFALQFFASPIMHAFGIPMDIAHEVGTYCRLMIIPMWLNILESHLENIFVNLGYVRCATLNSLFTGLGVDVAATYFFIFRWGWGMHGAALAQIVVKVSRLLVWLVLMSYFGLYNTICVTPPTSKDRLVTWKETKVYCALIFPSIVSNFSGWFIFELQIICLANIQGISNASLAAGAIWVQSESTIASIQAGWIQSVSMRTLKLLGREDVGAGRSYTVQCALSFALVFMTCTLPLLIWSEELAIVVSNDKEVQRWFSRIVWVLAIHAQTRICAINATSLLVPLGKGTLSVAIVFVSFYLFASPITYVIALTNLVTNSIPVKIVFTVATSCIAQVPIAIVGFSYFLRLGWAKAGEIIKSRANTDQNLGDNSYEVTSLTAIDDEASCS